MLIVVCSWIVHIIHLMSSKAGTQALDISGTVSRWGDWFRDRRSRSIERDPTCHPDTAEWLYIASFRLRFEVTRSYKFGKTSSRDMLAEQPEKTRRRNLQAKARV